MNLFFIAVGQLLLGYSFVQAGFRREIRQSRADPEDAPVIRSDKVDRLVQSACFVVGALFIVVGLFMLVILILERQH